MRDITKLTLPQEYAHANRKQHTTSIPSMLGTKGHQAKIHATVSLCGHKGPLSNTEMGTKGHSTATYGFTLRQIGTKGHSTATKHRLYNKPCAHTSSNWHKGLSNKECTTIHALTLRQIGTKGHQAKTVQQSMRSHFITLAQRAIKQRLYNNPCAHIRQTGSHMHND
jgi:hypothetical protein